LAAQNKPFVIENKLFFGGNPLFSAVFVHRQKIVENKSLPKIDYF
jgi:hypothetical protein